MRNLILLAVVVAVGGWLFSQIGKMYRAYGDFEERVDHYLDVVNEKNFDEVKKSLVQEAGKYGLELSASAIKITYEDAPQRSLAQSIVGDRLGTQFVNKKVGISCKVVRRIVSYGFEHDIDRSRMIQLKAIQSGTGGLEQMIDAAPRF